MGASGVVGMGVGQEEAIDDGGVDAIARDLVDDRLGCVWGVSRTGIDDHGVIAGRDRQRGQRLFGNRARKHASWSRRNDHSTDENIADAPATARRM